MLHIEESEVKKRLLKGHFGLEKENLRVDEEGFLVHTSHPFPGNEHIVRDFCENQVEVNTPVMDSLEAAVACLKQYEEDVKNTLQTLPAKEYLWPFSYSVCPKAQRGLYSRPWQIQRCPVPCGS